MREASRIFIHEVIFGFIFLMVCCYQAPAVAAETPEAAIRSTVFDTSKPYVSAVRSNNSANSGELSLGQCVIITVTSPSSFVQTARDADRHIILYVDNIPLKGVYPEAFTVENGKSILQFFIAHEDAPIELWGNLISMKKPGEFFKRKVSVSVGFEGDAIAIPTLVKGEKAFTLALVQESWLFTCMIVLGILIVLFVALAVQSNLIREGDADADGKKPFSLARTQMAAWFILIISAWLLLYAIKHTIATIPESLVALMGISSATGLGSILVTSNSTTLRQKKRERFIMDILSDGQGISLHRFQVFAWTVVMMAVFIRQVWSYYRMPTFDTNLLLLMGISSGTYIGYKFSEKSDNTKTEPQSRSDQQSS